MDRILVWNVRGVNNQSKHRDIKELMNLKKPGLVSLLETKVKNKEMGKLYTSIFPNWCFTTNNAWLDKGRIVLAWDPNIFTLDIKRCTSQLIHCIACRCQNKTIFQITLVYAYNDEEGRALLWRDLAEIATGITDPWTVIGDFNDVFSQEERMGRRIARKISGKFRKCVEDCQLEDLKYTGNFFTWNNKQQPDDQIYAKLDRVLVNRQWQDSFGNSEAVFLPEGSFDHSPIVVSFYKLEGNRRRPFKYYKMWTMANSYKEKVAKS